MIYLLIFSVIALFVLLVCCYIYYKSELKHQTMMYETVSVWHKYILDKSIASDKAINAYKEYNELLIAEINELAMTAYVHGWRSKRVELGELLRDKIKQLEK